MEQQANPAGSILFDIIESDNLVPNLAELDASDERNPDRIAQDAIQGYEIDIESRKDWLERNQDALDLAMLVAEEKNYPFSGASNVKYPLLTTAALQFNARAYPAIVQGNRVAKCVTWGEDPDGSKAAKAERVSEHLSYQMLVEMPEWEQDTDTLLLQLPILGCMFRKVYHDPSLGRKCTRLVPPQKLVMNYYARSLEDVPRKTEEMELYPYEIERRIRDGRFIDFEYSSSDSGKDDDASRADDSSEPHLFLEQHLMLDLDGDGMDEPYIATIHHKKKKLVRLVANFSGDSVLLRETAEGPQVVSIEADQYFVKYIFLPSPDGGAYGWGFGALLKDITESVNSSLNQILDAGHLSNVQGGLISAGLGIREKDIRLEMGEWRVVRTGLPLNQSVYPIKYDGPSPVLFQLLGFLVEAGRDISAIKDVLTGEVRQNMTASATLALIEQGMQVFTAIFKRVHRALKAELGLHAKCNREYLTPEQYNRLFDGQQPFDPARDYSEADMDILPVSDPNVSSRMQELAKAEFILQWAERSPVANHAAASLRVLEAAQIEDVEELIQPPAEPDPEVEMLHRLAAQLELQDKEADIFKKYADAIENMSQADEQAGFNRARLMFDILKAEVDAEVQIEQGRLRAMAGGPGNAAGAGATGGNGRANGSAA